MKPAFAIAAFVLLLSQTLWAGNSVGNGGDAVAAKFTQAAREIVHAIRTPDKRSARIVSVLKQAIETTTVRTQASVFIGNREVDAVNYPKEKLIVVGLSRWRRWNDKRVLILHEYLGVAGYDDSDYNLSYYLESLLPKLPVAPIF